MLRTVGFLTSFALVALDAVVASPPARATSAVSFSALSGTDRYDTAARLAEATFTTSNAAILASGVSFADALAGSYLAGRLNAPILLTDPNTLSTAAMAALAALRVKNVTILGGPIAVSTAIDEQLAATQTTSATGGPIVVTRIAGADRYQTAAMVAAQPGAAAVGLVSGAKTAIVASGLSYPDAVASGPMAFASALPILLTDPTSLSPATSAALAALGVTNVVIPGGTAAVSAQVETQLQAAHITTTRLIGTDRFDTAVKVANFEVDQLGFTYNEVVLTYGLDFPDALAAAPYAGSRKSPILLTDPLPVETAAAITSLAAKISQLTEVGRVDAFTGVEAYMAAGKVFTVNLVFTLNPGSQDCGLGQTAALNGVQLSVQAIPSPLRMEFFVTPPSGGTASGIVPFGAGVPVFAATNIGPGFSQTYEFTVTFSPPTDLFSFAGTFISTTPHGCTATYSVAADTTG
jgi:putative cell wall-binding protein